MKTFKTRLALLLAVSGALAAAAHADSTGNVSWGAYRSIVNPSVDDSYNRTTNTSVDASRSTADSFNRTTNTSVDASRTATGSFNRSTDDHSMVDSSRRTIDSFNTSLDAQSVTPTVKTVKSIGTVDAQSASNSGYMGGATQVGKQGDFTLSMGGGGGASAQGGKYFSPASTDVHQKYDLSQSNSARVGGDNNGIIRNQNNLNLGGSQINDSDLGNKQSFYAGPQTQIQGNSQHKDSAISTSASDTVTTTASK